MYANAMGPDAADRARQEDPFVSLKGLTSSLGNLSAAVGEHVMPVIVPALNSLTDTINGIAVATRDASGWQVGISSLALLMGAIGAWKVGGAAIGGLVALTTAGPSLQTAAVMLQGAATSLGGGAAAGGAAGAAGSAGWMAAAAAWVKNLSLAAAPAIAAELATGGPSSVEEYDRQVAQQGQIKAQLWDMINSAGGLFNPSAAVDHAPLEMTNEIPGLSGMVHPEALTNMGFEADKTKTKLEALNATLKPVVDLANINALVVLLRTAISLQGQLGAAPGSSGVSSQINASYSDFGVAP